MGVDGCVYVCCVMCDVCCVFMCVVCIVMCVVYYIYENVCVCVCVCVCVHAYYISGSVYVPKF